MLTFVNLLDVMLNYKRYIFHFVSLTVKKVITAVAELFCYVCTPIRSTQRLPASPCTTIAPSALSVCAVLCHRRRRRHRSSSGVIAALLSVAACHWYCCYDVMLLCGVTYNSCVGAPALSEINRNWNWNKAPAREQNGPPSILETNLGPPWKYLPWSERVAILSWLTSWLPKLIVASASLVWTVCDWALTWSPTT